jgi:glycosyltransferase involved in cell wall biosynthesis
MRIAFITFEYPPSKIGGAGVYARDLTKGLAGLGNDVTVLTTISPGLTTTDTRVPGIEVIRIGPTNDLPLRALQFWLELPTALKKADSTAGFDIVHFNGLCYWFARKRLSELPQVLTVHHLARDSIASTNPGILTRIRDLSGETGMLVPLVESRAVKCVDRFIAVSAHTKSRLIEEYEVNEECVDVISHGVDTSEYVFKNEDLETCRLAMGLSERPHLVFAGRIDDPRKNLELLIRTLPLILAEMEVELVVAGAGDTRKITGLVKMLSLTSSVRLLGYVDDKTLHKIFALADVIVIPSRLEGFGLTALEGLAAGKPIIATRVGALPEIVHDGVNGFLVPENVPEVLSNRILTILRNQQMASDMSMQNIATAEKRFSWTKAAIETVRAYQKAIDDFNDG